MRWKPADGTWMRKRRMNSSMASVNSRSPLCAEPRNRRARNVDRCARQALLSQNRFDDLRRQIGADTTRNMKKPHERAEPLRHVFARLSPQSGRPHFEVIINIPDA